MDVERAARSWFVLAAYLSLCELNIVAHEYGTLMTLLVLPRYASVWQPSYERDRPARRRQRRDHPDLDVFVGVPTGVDGEPVPDRIADAEQRQQRLRVRGESADDLPTAVNETHVSTGWGYMPSASHKPPGCVTISRESQSTQGASASYPLQTTGYSASRSPATENTACQASCSP
ncbi:hypothetical protein CFBP6600_23490 [Xanthomonas arboricola pv. corylina]|uniref:Uncharacterized protein n=1 Tax=Xanthomonas arboricola pv. corylina TaxID=487821 RepID=A0ABM8RYU1_9XANT|nr:hypothetical protein XAC301_23610 [Xanthomonas arboricola pv. corylina]CAE6779404.1 hypothetical protein XAC301_23610 [Xanthomonas arboricola pv. corylina]CAE6779622.1 hypothetical protein CFBP6600_23490 [Xanthomonas arboricola pv. corylina]CAE6779651.1 hypothetical protein CFBP6600_23490 [Xanthomonas arboricola pv. corylina]